MPAARGATGAPPTGVKNDSKAFTSMFDVYMFGPIDVSSPILGGLIISACATQVNNMLNSVESSLDSSTS